ncbi:hypothetical protein FGB62_73g029 [Gracilaria domingensis]|nr:hypothetical protein FGB62_73g029 [Gracilaria domingensis]
MSAYTEQNSSAAVPRKTVAQKNTSVMTPMERQRILSRGGRKQPEQSRKRSAMRSRITALRAAVNGSGGGGGALRRWCDGVLAGNGRGSTRATRARGGGWAALAGTATARAMRYSGRRCARGAAMLRGKQRCAVTGAPISP